MDNNLWTQRTSAGPEHGPVISQFIKHVLYQREARRGAGLFWRQKSFSLWQNSGRKNNRNKHLYNIAIA